MARADADWPEQEAFMNEIEAALDQSAPDVYRPFMRDLFNDTLFLAARPIGPASSFEDLKKSITELLFLLNQPNFHRSVSHRRLLACLAATTLLRRPQWCHTSDIKKFFLAGQVEPNVSEYITKIQGHIGECLSLPRSSGTRFLVFNADHKAGGYPVRFCEPSHPDVMERLLCAPRRNMKIGFYDGAGYCGRLALGLKRGLAVQVVADVGESMLFKDHVWILAEQTSQIASLSVALLDPLQVTDDHCRERLIEGQRRLLERIARLANPFIRVNVGHHSAIGLPFEIARIGPDLFVGAKGGDAFEEVKDSHPLFRSYLVCLQSAIESCQDLTILNRA